MSFCINASFENENFENDDSVVQMDEIKIIDNLLCFGQDFCKLGAEPRSEGCKPKPDGL